MYSSRAKLQTPSKTIKWFAGKQELNDVWFDQVKIEISESTNKYLLL